MRAILQINLVRYLSSERDVELVECDKCASQSCLATARLKLSTKLAVSIGGRQNVNNKPRGERRNLPHVPQLSLGISRPPATTISKPER